MPLMYLPKVMYSGISIGENVAIVQYCSAWTWIYWRNAMHFIFLQGHIIHVDECTVIYLFIFYEHIIQFYLFIWADHNNWTWSLYTTFLWRTKQVFDLMPLHVYDFLKKKKKHHSLLFFVVLVLVLDVWIVLALL